MLVLTRRPGEAILVDKTTKITVLSNERGRVRLGIEAPQEVQVDREEIHLLTHPELQPPGAA